MEVETVDAPPPPLPARAIARPPTSSPYASTHTTAAAIGAGTGGAALTGGNGGGTLSDGGPQLWVTKWVDYSNKYGLGYLLADGSAGVYFNDSSKAVMAANNVDFEYVERKSSRNLGGERTAYTTLDYPPELHKKVTLLRHFRDYLVEDSNAGGRLSGSKEKVRTTDSVVRSDERALAAVRCGSVPAADLPYVKRWLRTKHAILFRMSNRTVQVVFYDFTELLLSSEARLVSYTNKYGVRATYSLATVFQQPRPDLAKRMKYTKDIMFHLLQQTPGTAGVGVNGQPAADHADAASPL
jgi:polo-like kinase 1